MLTEKDFCDYDTCVALSELGCPIPKYATINIHTKEKEWKMWLPLYNAQKFLREEKDAHIAVKPTKGKYYCIILLKDKTPMLLTHENIVVRYFDSYEEALSESIKEVVKILKNNGKAN